MESPEVEQIYPINYNILIKDHLFVVKIYPEQTNTNISHGIQ